MKSTKERGGSTIIVEPQELTKFLRQSQEISELIESTVQLDTLITDKKQIRADKSGKKGVRRYAGLFFALLAGLCFTLAFLIVKKLNGVHDPLSLSFWRYSSFLICILPYIIYLKYGKKINVFHSWYKGKKGTELIFAIVALPLSATFGIAVFALRYYSLYYLTVADSVVISFSGAIFTIVFGHFFLNEKCGFVTIPLSCFTLLGVFVIARPPLLTGEKEYDRNALIGTLIAFGGTILTSAYYVTMRKMRGVHFSVTILIISILGLAECGTIAASLGKFSIPNGLTEISLVFAMSFLSLIATVAIVAALKYEQAGIVNLIRMTDVVFSFLLQYAFFNVVPDIFSITGACIVTIGVLLIALRTVLSTLPPENFFRRCCCLLLK